MIVILTKFDNILSDQTLFFKASFVRYGGLKDVSETVCVDWVITKQVQNYIIKDIIEALQKLQ